MIRTTLIVLAAAVLVGCNSNGELNNPFDNDKGSTPEAQLAAFAASSHYPTTQSSHDLQAAAMVNRDNDNIRIVNFSDNTLNNASVWVNGSFVHQIGVVPAHGSVTIPRDEFYDRTGQTLASVHATVTRVELQSGDHFYLLQGPAFE